MSNLDKIYTKELRDFKKTGHCVIRNFIPKQLISSLLSNLDEIISYLKQNGNEGSHINFACKDKEIVNSIHRVQELNHKGIKKFIDENCFNEIAECLIGQKCELFSIQAFLKPPNYGLKTPAHQDNAYWCHEGNGGITIWLSIDKAGKFNGMMRYAINSNSKLIDHISSENTPGSSLIIPEEILKNYKWTQPELNPGDIAIHDGLVIHCSEKNNSQYSRRGFLLTYRSYKCKRDLKKFNSYLKNLEKMYDR